MYFPHIKPTPPPAAHCKLFFAPSRGALSLKRDPTVVPLDEPTD